MLFFSVFLFLYDGRKLIYRKEEEEATGSINEKKVGYTVLVFGSITSLITSSEKERKKVHVAT